MSEQTSKPAVGLHRKALKAAEKQAKLGWMAHQLRMMNPKKMSPDDITTCNNVLVGK